MEKRLEGLDLNLLLALHWLLSERNVTAAAAKLGLSQPAASRALGKLRDIFDDPLLVKVGGEMAPTRLAESLQPAIAHAMERCREVLRISDAFTPSHQTGQFRIACADYLGAYAAGIWARIIQPEAPDLCLDLVTPKLDSAKEMITGKTDLCVLPETAALELPPSLDVNQFVQKPVFEKEFMSAIRKDHPLAGTPLSLDQFLALDHIQISPIGRPTSPLDQALEGINQTRRISYQTSSYLMSVSMVRFTDCVITAPRALIEMRSDSLYMFPTPLTLKTTTMAAVWHPNWTHDARHRWVRNKLFDAMKHPERLCCPVTGKPWFTASISAVA